MWWVLVPSLSMASAGHEALVSLSLNCEAMICASRNTTPFTNLYQYEWESIWRVYTSIPLSTHTYPVYILQNLYIIYLNVYLYLYTMMDSTNLGAIHFTPSFRGVQNQKSVAAFLLHIFGPRKSSRTLSDEWKEWTPWHSNSVHSSLSSTEKTRKLGVWTGGQITKRSKPYVSVVSVASRRLMGEPGENVIDIDSEDEHRCEAEVPFTSRKSRATRGSGASSHSSSHSSSCCHHVHHVLPNKIYEIWEFSKQNSVRQLLRPPPLLWGCSEPAWMFAQVPQFLSSFANSSIPSTSQAQVPQRSFVCQFSTWRVPVCQAVI